MTLLCILWFLLSAFQTGLCFICCYLLGFQKVLLYVLIAIRNNNPLWSRELNGLKDSWFLPFFSMKWHPCSELFLSSRFLPIATVYPKKDIVLVPSDESWSLILLDIHTCTHMHTHVFIWYPSSPILSASRDFILNLPFVSLGSLHPPRLLVFSC